MARLIDYYPEILREIYDVLEAAVKEAGYPDETADVILQVTEWMRKNWSRRTLIPSWWGVVEIASDEADLPGVEVQSDRVRTLRGRELRAVVWGFVVTVMPNAARPCELASLIAATVEIHWSTQRTYIPAAAAVDRFLRDLMIWRDFSGFSSLDRVVAKHDVCQSVIYEIFRRVQRDKDAREQPLLPGLQPMD